MMKEYKLYIQIFLFICLIFYIYYGLTAFKRTIEISQHIDYVSGFGRMLYSSNMIADKNNTIYEVSNSILLLKMNAAENIAKLDVGKKYVVKGYGIRVPLIGLYPKIVEVVTK